MSEIDNVRAFHEKFGLLRPDSPGHLTKRKLAERANFMLEELKEFAHAAGLTLSTSTGDFVHIHSNQNLEAQADALVDLVYVALGTAIQLGLPWTRLWDDVHRANMAKVRGASDRAYVDVVKPPGWQPPRAATILWSAGYRRNDWTTDGVVNDRMCRDDKR